MPRLALRAPDAHAATQAGITRATLRQVLGLWQFVSFADLDGSWAAVSAQITSAVTIGQFRAAGEADTYLEQVVYEQGLTAPTEGRVRAETFAGVAADGRPLGSLLAESVITAKTLIRDGHSQAAVMAGARSQLQLLATTTLQDTGRAAVSAATTARPLLSGYTRMLNPPSCIRCVILAGRVYRWNADFPRHEGCDCRQIPTAENVAGDLTTDPHTYLQNLPRPDRDKLIDRYAGRDAGQAYADGADLNRLVNARRSGLSVAGKRPTRGVPARLTPERIYDLAGDDRAEAIRLLQVNGFIF